MKVPRPVSIFVLTIVISAAAIWLVILILFPGTWVRQCCRTKRQAVEEQLEEFEQAIRSFHSGRGRLPISLEELVEPDVRRGKPSGYCGFKMLPVDPWGQDYEYFQGMSGCVVLSAGSDLVVGSDDDFLRVVGTR